MKKKHIFAFLLSIVCAFTMGFTLAACAGGDEPEGETSKTYTVTFDANGGKFSDNKTTVTATTDANGKVSLPATEPARVDYAFSGYNTASDGTGNEVTAATVYTANTTVYAKWTASGTTDPDDDKDNVGGSGATSYTFEAEYTDLTDLTGDLGSGTAYNKEMIKADDGASQGYYVENFNIVDSTITYQITSDKATTAELSVLIRATSAGSCDSELLIVKVNGTAVNFEAATITSDTENVTAIKKKMLFTKLVIGEVQLTAGTNTITFTVGEKENASGTGTYKLSYGFDSMILSSEATLTWSPITDWDSFYPDF